MCYLEHTQDGPRSNTYDPTPSIAPRTAAHARTPKQEQHISKAATGEMSHYSVYIANSPIIFLVYHGIKSYYSNILRPLLGFLEHSGKMVK